jgi:hypothetical protein
MSAVDIEHGETNAKPREQNNYLHNVPHLQVRVRRILQLLIIHVFVIKH